MGNITKILVFVVIFMLGQIGISSLAGSSRSRTISSASSVSCASPQVRSLIDAIEEDDQTTVELFLMEDPKINAGHDSFGNTPLHIACIHKASLDILIALISAGAILDAQNYRQETPLMLACKNKCSLEKIQLLLGHGACPRRQDYQGSTVLHHACDGGNIEIATLLLEKYNVAAYACNLAAISTLDARYSPAMRALVQKHKDRQDLERRRIYAATTAIADDADYVEVLLPAIREEDPEDFELV